jgi:hypothetical protein
VFENSALWRIFDHKRDEDGGWNEWHNHKLYSSLSIIRMIKSVRMRWAEHAACMGDDKCIQTFSQKNEGKRPHGRPMHIWNDNIMMEMSGELHALNALSPEKETSVCSREESG